MIYTVFLTGARNASNPLGLKQLGDKGVTFTLVDEIEKDQTVFIPGAGYYMVK